MSIPNSLRTLSLNQTTPPAGPPGTASQLTFNDDGSKLIASVKGVPPASVGFLAVWDVQPASGALSPTATQISTVPGGSLTFSLTPVPGKNAFVSTDPGVGFTVFDLDDFARSSAVPIAGQSATCWSSFSPSTGSFFLSDVGTGTITEVRVDDNLQASIVKVRAAVHPCLRPSEQGSCLTFRTAQQYPLGANAGTIDNDVATIDGKECVRRAPYVHTGSQLIARPSHSFLFVMGATSASVDVLTLDGPGKARKTFSLDIAGAARRANIPIGERETRIPRTS